MREPFRKFRLIVNLLLILEIILGVTIIAVTAAYQNTLSSFMTEGEVKMLFSTFFNAYILAFQLIVTYLCSLCMWRRVWMRRYSTSIQLLLNIWSFFCFLIVIGGCATIWALLDSSGALSESVARILLRGIEVYYENPEWKFLWDRLQYSRECCGVNRYDDWMYASWMPKQPFVVTPSSEVPKLYRFIDYESDSKEYSPPIRIIMDCNGKKHYYYQATTGAHSSHENYPNKVFGFTKNDGSTAMGGEQILAPYACCKHDSISCYQSYLPRIEGSKSIPQLNLTEINTEACLPLFKEFLWSAIHILLFLMLAAILIDILICCLTKYLMFRNEVNSYRELDGDMSFYDDNGNALVIVKCPPKVKCITLEESNSYDSDIPNICSDTEPCICCCGDERNPVNGSQIAEADTSEQCAMPKE